MKRLNGLYEKICSMDNLILADAVARKGKMNQYGVKAHIKNEAANLEALRQMLITRSFKTSNYSTFTIFEPKERLIFRLPYFPDRILHHAIMNILEPVFTARFTADTYSCIKGRGIHGAAHNLRRALRDVHNTQFCLKLDIRKFYPSIDHTILKQLLRRIIKDEYLLELLDGIIDSAEGLPIGNYLSQFLANFFLTGFDHWLKEVKRVKYYFRYSDDMIFLSSDKAYLHTLRADIEQYLREELKLTLKDNYQVFPVAARGIDFVGYRFYHTHTLLRKRIKRNMARTLAKGKNPKSIAAYNGWLVHCNGKHLQKTLMAQ